MPRTRSRVRMPQNSFASAGAIYSITGAGAAGPSGSSSPSDMLKYVAGSRHKLVCLSADRTATLRRVMLRRYHGHLNGHLLMAEEGPGPPFSATSGRRRRGACVIRSRPHRASHTGYTKRRQRLRRNTWVHDKSSRSSDKEGHSSVIALIWFASISTRIVAPRTSLFGFATEGLVEARQCPVPPEKSNSNHVKN